MKHPTAIVCLVLTSACWNASAHMLPAQGTPQQAVDQLLATDRDAGAAGTNTTVVPALTSMFAPDVIMQGPTGMVRGLAAATEALKANPANATATLTWAPVRGGVSGDGQQGFTFGYMTLRPAAGAPVPLKYLAYWVKREGQWRVAAYKRRARPAGDVSTTLLSPVIPAAMVPATTDTALIGGHRASVIAAEQAFSDEAQRIGLGAAFTKHGWPEAMNMGGQADVEFVIGNVLIGRNIGQGSPTDSSPVFWSADEAIVASSGDLGVTFGLIRSQAQPGSAGSPPPPQPFFTVWRKVNGVWKYIAE